MGILQNSNTGKQHALKPLHVVGRHKQHVDTVLPSADASLLHATIRWSEQQWLLIDQSRNGCFVNGHALTKAHPTPLALHDEIRFGMLDGTHWKVVDAAAPGDQLIPLSPELDVIALGSFHVLPDDLAPQVCLYRSPSGHWVRESVDETVELREGDFVHVGKQVWRLSCVGELQNTLDSHGPTQGVKLTFRCSLDEEHVYLNLVNGSRSVDMGERVHHYLLLLLARQRLRDGVANFDIHAQGWMDLEALIPMLGMDRVHLNIQIFRLRKQFEDAAAQGLVGQDFIERRRGGVRLGALSLEVWRGSKLEGRWSPALLPTPPQTPVIHMKTVGHDEHATYPG